MLVWVSMLLSEVSTLVKLVVPFPDDGSNLLTGCNVSVSVVILL